MFSLTFGSASSVLSIIVNNRTMKYENFRNRINVNIFPLTLHHKNFSPKCQKWKNLFCACHQLNCSFIHGFPTVGTNSRVLVIFPYYLLLHVTLGSGLSVDYVFLFSDYYFFLFYFLKNFFVRLSVTKYITHYMTLHIECTHGALNSVNM